MEAASAAVVAEVLQTAKNWLLENSWQKGLSYNDDQTAACASGAIELVIGTEEAIWRYVVEFLNHAANQRGHEHIASFNDAFDTTFNDVIDVYDEAILAAKELAAPASDYEPTK